jgi:RAB protein geranylgeranyltransferase component A
MTILYYLLFMMRVDGVIDQQEEQLVHEAGFRLGFNEKMVDDLIHVMKTYLNKEIPPEVMLQQIKKYLN